MRSVKRTREPLPDADLCHRRRADLHNVQNMAQEAQ